MINFPSHIHIENNQLKIDLENPFENIIRLGKEDFIPYYLNNDNPGNKGGNSFILCLTSAQEFDEDEGYPVEPDYILKICKTWKSRFEKPRSLRFKREIDALLACNKENIVNIAQVHHYGTANIPVKIYGGNSKEFHYYTMDFAQDDLSSYLLRQDPSVLDKLELFRDICRSLKILYSKGFYHRDIKPDNILFINGKWILADLGLVYHREKDVDLEIEQLGEWIGPRGWMSPESMNKFLCEGNKWSDIHDTKIDHQSDIYQLGKVMWTILQGNSPEGGIKRSDFLVARDDIYQIVRTMLNHSKKSRYRHIDKVIVDLGRIIAKIEREYTIAI